MKVALYWTSIFLTTEGVSYQCHFKQDADYGNAAGRQEPSDEVEASRGNYWNCDRNSHPGLEMGITLTAISDYPSFGNIFA